MTFRGFLFPRSWRWVAGALVAVAFAGRVLADSPPAYKTYDNDGIRFSYPANWKPATARTACLCVVAPPQAGKGTAEFSLDVPKLPPFAGWFISPAKVANGYIDALKKDQIPDAVVNEDVPITVAGCAGRRVKCSGHAKGDTKGDLHGRPAVDVAIILVHSRKVYILSCDSDDKGYPIARAALDVAVASCSWR